jgi:hypothetical protein
MLSADLAFIEQVVDQGFLSFEEMCRRVCSRVTTSAKRVNDILRWCASPRPLAQQRYSGRFGDASKGTYEVCSREGTSWREELLRQKGLLLLTTRRCGQGKSESESRAEEWVKPLSFDPSAVSAALRENYAKYWSALVDYAAPLAEAGLSRPLLIEPVSSPLPPRLTSRLEAYVRR